MEDLGQKLLEAQLVTEEGLTKALAQQKSSGGSLAFNLVKTGAVGEERLMLFLSELFHVALFDVAHAEVDPAITRLIPGEVANKFLAVPVSRVGRRLKVAMASPDNLFAIEDIKFITGYDVEPVLSSESDLRRAIERHYDTGASLSEVMKGMEDDLQIVDDDEDEEADLGTLAEEAPIVKLVNSLITDAVRKGASDIHVEPYEKSLRVRFRIDGTLYEMMSPPVKFKSAILSRLKIMAELDIAERRLPQDGRFKTKILNKSVEFRVSSLPTIHGEKIVLRVLDQSNLNVDLTRLGFHPASLEAFMKAIMNPYGMVLVTGPTGSGKTTTLYSALSKLNTPEVNIMTAEDPVEYNLEGVNQVLVQEDIGRTFAAALRAFLRQDPNIILVGEVRDAETASIAIKAALTGHLVLSTLHTNDAASSVNRLIDMGMEPFLVAASVNLIQAQRLVRRVCPHCKVPLKVHPELLEELQYDRTEWDGIELFEGQGCVECRNTGYKGRLAVHEVMPVSPTIRDMILDRAPTNVLKKQGVDEGYLTLRKDALIKLKNGLTTAEEVLKETAPDRF
ncbi:MAG TPA: type IV-A pilus assembly ATPase PilB [Candidatus Saccharimonadales bacterium]|nr:type IV-A pilus assembly ATPase PilB [Candidatus Saccharimonadales bacterium]